MHIFVSIIAWLYYSLIFFIPLILYPHSSEIFEFNKMITTYFFAVLIMFFWAVRMIQEKRLIFKKTFMDAPILVFLGTLIITTLFSIDPHTSFYGYYTRFHGGLLSFVTYSLLYWAFVSNLDKKRTINAINVLLISSLLVSIYGILQHFGIDKDLWVQDVQGRIFSTLGQPNWLAAWIVAITPFSWIYINTRQGKKIINKENIYFGNYWLSVVIFIIYYLVLSYTRSRSGFIAFLLAFLIYYSTVFFIHFYKRKKSLLFKKVAVPFTFVLIYSLIAGTVFTPSIFKLSENIAKPAPQVNSLAQESTQTSDVPEVNFSSTDIRFIVWEGAVDVWLNNPILGTGPETFAYSYYNYRPNEHNLVSEWDFLYNKAHNEYLNQLATTGILGTLGYLIFHLGVMIFLIKNFLTDNKDTKYSHLAMLAGFVSIIVTNFAGFSVVPVGLTMFMFPAFSFALNIKSQESTDEDKTLGFDPTQKIYLAVISIITLMLIIRIFNYWRADHHYSTAQILNDTQNFQESSKTIQKAIDLRPNEAVYWQELSESEAGLALLLIELDQNLAQNMALQSQEHTELAEEMNPYDVNTLRKQGSVYLKLSYVDPEYLLEAEESVARAVDLAPTEAKLIYNLGVIRLRLGMFEEGIKTVEKAIELRPIYADARYALALAYIEVGKPEEAEEQLNYILENINPNDSRAKTELENIESGIDLSATPSSELQ